MSTSSPGGQCLILVDIFSHFHFKDGSQLANALMASAPAMVAAAALCRSRKVPVVYCNDNFGRWHETWEKVFGFTARDGLPASAYLLKQLYPEPSDIVLLKSRHSAFFHTQLVPLLEDLRAKSLAFGGAATDACVFCSAIDAHVRGFQVAVLGDAVAAATEERGRRALEHMRDSLGLDVCSHQTWLDSQLAKT